MASDKKPPPSPDLGLLFATNSVDLESAHMPTGVNLRDELTLAGQVPGQGFQCLATARWPQW